MYLHSLSSPSSLSLNRSSVNIKPFGPFFPSVAGLLRCTTISAMTLLTTELPLVTNSDDDDVMMVMMMKISGMTLLTTIKLWPLEHFCGNFEKNERWECSGHRPGLNVESVMGCLHMIMRNCTSVIMHISKTFSLRILTALLGSFGTYDTYYTSL